ncbi:MAG: lytic murein transglycosylase [Epsilonproteobacteria bacterium]|nr:lytic murein transglycosylase [Campylobacterota bacterium]
MRKVLLIIFSSLALFGVDYSTTFEGKRFIDKMHKKYGFSKSYIRWVLSNAVHREDVLQRYNGKRKNATDFSWARYKDKIFIDESIELGKEFMRKYNYYLSKAAKRYGVSKEIITAFIRVESKFGLYGNEDRSIDVLTTLAFNPNRKQRFFRSELEKLFLVAKKSNMDILKIRGSFAGAMGCVQQMPSIYLKYGVDLDRDGVKNPNSMADCIGSIAKFLRVNGWDNSKEGVYRAKVSSKDFLKLKSGVRSRYSYSTLIKYGIYPPYKSSFYYIRLYDKYNKKYDIFLGDSNYRVITLYNYSKQYATSIALYAKELKK